MSGNLWKTGDGTLHEVESFSAGMKLSNKLDIEKAKLARVNEEMHSSELEEKRQMAQSRINRRKRTKKHDVVSDSENTVESLQLGIDSLEIAGDTEITEEIVSRFRFPLLSPNQYADYVLDAYKQIRGPEHTDYEVVRPLGCYRVLVVVPDYKILGLLDCCHVSFIARSPRRSHCNEVIFFGELIDFGYGTGLELVNFSIREPDSPGKTNGCGFCPQKDIYPHPHDSYFAGKWDFVPTTSSSQKQKAILFVQDVISNLKKNNAANFRFNKKSCLFFRPEPFEDMVIEPNLRAPELSDFEYAKLALEYFKKEDGTVVADYEVLEPLGVFRFLSVPGRIYEVIDWCHVSFTAKPRKSDCDDDILLFFAELSDFSHGDKLALNYCKMSKPGALEITFGCGFCPPDEKHPHLPGAYYAGFDDHKPSSYISQKEMVVCFQRQVIAKRKEVNLAPRSELRRLRPRETVNRDPSCFIPLLSDKEYADRALTYINEAEGVEYKLLKTTYSYRQGCTIRMSGFGQWCHVCFSAKPENSDVPPVHFFAELKDAGVGKFRLNVYSRMDLGVGTEEGCGICPISEGYPHPVALNYNAGSWPHYGCAITENRSLCTVCSIQDEYSRDCQED